MSNNRGRSSGDAKYHHPAVPQIVPATTVPAMNHARHFGSALGGGLARANARLSSQRAAETTNMALSQATCSDSRWYANVATTSRSDRTKLENRPKPAERYSSRVISASTFWSMLARSGASGGPDSSAELNFTATMNDWKRESGVVGENRPT